MAGKGRVTIREVAEGVEAEAADRGRLCVVGATGGDSQREMEFVQLMHGW